MTYPFYEITQPAPLKDYLAKLCEQPEIIRSYYQSQAAYHHIGLEKATRIPDVTVSLGYSYDAGDNGLVAELAFPLPIWNQNQGNIKKARYEKDKMDEEKKLLRQKLEVKLSNTYTELVRSYEEANDIQNTLLKTAHQALNLALEGYQEGKFDYMEALEAKRSYYEIRGKYIETLVNYHIKKAEIDYLKSETD